MKITGFVKSSFLDYPAHLSCVIFTRGCNMNCWYCHNQHFESRQNFIPEQEIFDFLEKRKGLLEGVVISGGEPTLQNDLENFIIKVKTMGFKIKLDTNGTNFDILKRLIDKKLIDFVAVDVKAPLNKYKKITNTDDNMASIEATIDLLLTDVIDYEFRTTFSPDLSTEDIKQIALRIKGAKAYALQKYRLTPNKITMPERPYPDHQVALDLAKEYINNIIVRGL